MIRTVQVKFKKVLYKNICKKKIYNALYFSSFIFTSFFTNIFFHLLKLSEEKKNKRNVKRATLIKFAQKYATFECEKK